MSLWNILILVTNTAIVGWGLMVDKVHFLWVVIFSVLKPLVPIGCTADVTSVVLS